MEKILIWGVAKNPPHLYETLEKKYEILGWIDSKKEVQHQYINGKYVYSPNEMADIAFDKIVIGAAIYVGTRQIMEECINRGVLKENINSTYVMKTQRMSLKQIFLMQHKVGEPCCFESFTRMNLLIQYAFVEQYYEKNMVGFDLAERYMKLVCQEERAENHYKYFLELIKSIEQYGFEKKSYLGVNREGSLIDGTHRIACLLWGNIKQADVDIYNTDWNLGEEGVRTLAWLQKRSDIFLQEDIDYLQKVYDVIVKQLGINTRTIKRERVDLWESTEI